MKLTALRMNGFTAAPEKQEFRFSRLQSDAVEPVFDGANLKNALLFLFCGENTFAHEGTAEADFSMDGKKYTLRRSENGVATLLEEGETRCEGEDAEQFLKETFGDLPNFLSGSFLSEDEFERFRETPSLRFFPEIFALQDISARAKQNYDSLAERVVQTQEQLTQAAKGQLKFSGRSSVEHWTTELKAHREKFASLQNELGECKRSIVFAEWTDKLFRDWQKNASKLQGMLAAKEETERNRKAVTEYDAVKEAVPKLTALLQMKKQMAQWQEEIARSKKEIEWSESERLDCHNQLEEKRKEYESQTGRQYAFLENGESARQKKEQNSVLHAELSDLQMQAEERTSKKAKYAEQIAEAEESIRDVKERLNELNAPAKSVGELLEIVRLSAKIKEIETQLEKANSELLVKESQLSEKQLLSEEKAERLKQIVNLDKTMSPLKAKENYLKFLDAKLKKTEQINQSLMEKEKNLDEEMNRYAFEEIEVENSLECLQTALVQKQFNRDRMLSANAAAEQFNGLAVGDTCPICSNPILYQPTFTVTNMQFLEEDLEETKSEIYQRIRKKTEIASKKNMLSGALKEIRRNIEINNSECSEMRKERNKIAQKFAELLKANDDENLLGYFKAFDTNATTPFLLDMQKECVQLATETREMRRTVDGLKSKIYELNSRLSYLNETYSQLDKDNSALELVVETNEQVKNELMDIGERLNANYAKHLALLQASNENERKLLEIQASISEKMHQLKENETWLLRESEREEESGVTSAAADTLKAELDELQRAAQELDREIFDAKLDLERTKVLAKEKIREFVALRNESRALLGSVGKKEELLEKVLKNEADDVEQMREQISAYDRHLKEFKAQNATLSEQVKERISETGNLAELTEKAKGLEQSLGEERTKIMQAEEELQKAMDAQTISAKLKMRLAQLTGELDTVSKLKEMLDQTQVMEVVLNERIQMFVKQAAKYLRVLTGRQYSLGYDEDLFVTNRSEKTEFSALDADVQYLVYAALCCSLPKGDRRLTSLIFEKQPPEWEKVREGLKKFDRNYPFATEAEKSAEPTPAEAAL